MLPYSSKLFKLNCQAEVLRFHRAACKHWQNIVFEGQMRKKTRKAITT